MGRDLRVKVRFEGDASSLAREAKRGQSAVDSLASGFGAGAARLAAASFAGVLGVRALTGAISSSVSAAADQEDAINRLNAALEPLGPAAGEVAAALIRQAEALQNTTRFSDDAIEEGQALVATFTKDTEAIQLATQAAVDLAAALKLDLRTAFLLVGKAIAGETGALSRYGITIDENIPKAEKFAAVVGQIQERFGGRAVADLDTFRGAVTRLGNAFGEVQEAAGGFITESETSISIVNFLANALLTTAGAFEGVTVGARDASTAVDELGAKAGTAAAHTQGLSDAQRAFVQALVQLKTGAESAAIGVDGLTDAQRRLQRIQGELAAGANEFATALKAIGVSLEADVASKIETNNQLLEEARRRLSLAGISFQDFANISKAVATENAKLAGTFVEVGEAATEIHGAFREGVGAMRENASVNRELQSSVRATGSAYAAAGRQVQFFNAVVGVTARDRRSQGQVDAALAAGMTPILGGTRIRLPGGGSRLLGSRSFD